MEQSFEYFYPVSNEAKRKFENRVKLNRCRNENGLGRNFIEKQIHIEESNDHAIENNSYITIFHSFARQNKYFYHGNGSACHTVPT